VFHKLGRITSLHGRVPAYVSLGPVHTYRPFASAPSNLFGSFELLHAELQIIRCLARFALSLMLVPASRSPSVASKSRFEVCSVCKHLFCTCCNFCCERVLQVLLFASESWVQPFYQLDFEVLHGLYRTFLLCSVRPPAANRAFAPVLRDRQLAVVPWTDILLHSRM